MECAQLQITGGGSASPATVSFPGAYSGTDPGIKINIYQPLSSYTIPGPSVFTCGGSGSGPAAPPTTAAPTTVQSPAAPPPTSSSTQATAAQYAQCGGIGYAV